MADLAKRLDEIVGRFAVVFDDQEAHRGVGLAHGGLALCQHGTVTVSMQGERSSRARKEKRAGGEAGGLHRPSLPTEGGIFHRKVTCEGTGFAARPRKAPSAGATIANDTLHSCEPRQPLAIGTATKRDEPPLLTRIRT